MLRLFAALKMCCLTLVPCQGLVTDEGSAVIGTFVGLCELDAAGCRRSPTPP
ncbi:hypothetical protein CDCA_CDCA01G0074 [Cyanidium caldarium]|uniref:Uncharacterized protein n=1 Tax=Cyanidium caldarium TaxID=2771 RepID=A0AAV9IPI5_CYACA|nr:hypothetical protein CDCA_CDCA01G0074 [Cyanidium caldarium]